MQSHCPSLQVQAQPSFLFLQFILIFLTFISARISYYKKINILKTVPFYLYDSVEIKRHGTSLKNSCDCSVHKTCSEFHKFVRNYPHRNLSQSRRMHWTILHFSVWTDLWTKSQGSVPYVGQIWAQWQWCHLTLQRPHKNNLCSHLPECDGPQPKITIRHKTAYQSSFPLYCRHFK